MAHVNENNGAQHITENNGSTANIAPAALTDVKGLRIPQGIGPEEFADGLARLLTSCDLSKFPEGILKAHKAKDADGKVIEGADPEGYFVSIDVRLPGTTEMTLGDGKLYSKNVRFGVSAFKVQDSPYAMAAKAPAEKRTALTMDAVKAKLAAAQGKGK